MGWRPLMLTGLLKDILVRHFARPAGVGAPELRDIVWRGDERTGILIESIYRWRGELVEKRPAIIVKRNAYKNLRVVMADRSGVTDDGHYEYSTFWVGSHTLFCLSRSGAGADVLATEVQKELTGFAPVVIDYLNLFKWSVTEVGDVSEIEEAKECFAVPVTVGWCYQEVWRLELESKKLGRVAVSKLLDGADLG